MSVFAGVTIWRAIAAKRHAACLARPQVDPRRPDLHAFLAFAALRLFDRRDRVEMRAPPIRHCDVTLFHVANRRNVLITRAGFSNPVPSRLRPRRRHRFVNDRRPCTPYCGARLCESFCAAAIYKLEDPANSGRLDACKPRRRNAPNLKLNYGSRDE
jgi:hypothetical protein